MADLDSRVRLAAFQFLAEQVILHPDTLPYDVLQRGFDFEGRRVPVIGPQGIFKPAILPDMPLSIYTAPVVEGRPRPYEDEVRSDVILYRYRGTDPQHRDNVGLRLAMQRRVPLAYLHGIVPGEYVAAWPVYVVGDDPARLCFTLEVDAPERALVSGPGDEPMAAEARRAYVTVVTLRRLHQRAFRERVLQPIRRSARSAGSVTGSCSTRHTSCRMVIRAANRCCPMGLPCVACTTRRSTATSSASAPT